MREWTRSKMKNKIPSALLNEFKKDDVIVFLGAGVSTAAGLPTWGALIAILQASLLEHSAETREFFDDGDPLVKAQYLYDHVDRITVIKEIRDVFQRAPTSAEVHKQLTALPLKAIITTNWDSLIESAFQTQHLPMTPVWRDNQISSITIGSTTLVKFHGTIEDADSLVFAEDDYYDSYQRNPLIRQLLATLVATSTVVLLGYSYRDFDFRLLYSFLKQSMGSNTRSMYILLLNEPEVTSTYFRKRGLIPVEFEGSSKGLAFQNFLSVLSDAVATVADSSQDRLKILHRENSEILRRGEPTLIRNMASLGPLATPSSPTDPVLFGQNTNLEVLCATNWRDILSLPGSSAKLILCLDEVRQARFYSKTMYIERIETLLENLDRFRDRILVVDSGRPLIMTNLDIYGDRVCLENSKINIASQGYGHLRCYRARERVDSQINLFDAMFESIHLENLEQAQEHFNRLGTADMVFDLVVHRLQQMRIRIETEWT